MDILNNVCGYSLDEEQKSVVLSNSRYSLVTAGAGSGKSLTIIGKIRYLIETLNIKEKDILVISFTNETVNSLTNKLKETYNYNIDVKTFHKLAIKILDNTKEIYEITSNDYLTYIIEEYFNTLILDNDIWIKKVLKYLKIEYQNNYKDTYIRNINSKKISNLKTKINRFISLFKSANLDINNFISILKRNKYNLFLYKEQIFLRLTLDIYLLYINELKSSKKLDLDDLIITATNRINLITFKYKYIIIDEYQDTSYIKLEFIKKLVEKQDSNLLVVGDDFQSIYRFTGCDLDLFINFKNYFKSASIYKITNTYRCSNELIHAAGIFIMKNKYQVKKELNAKTKLEKPIKIIYYSKQINTFKKLLYYINTNMIMVIGRNNKDINRVVDNKFTNIDNIYRYGSYHFTYLTAHKSKGLESNVVIIINLENSIYGFPSLRKEEKVFKYINNKKDKYYLEEERRLFYVALTRSKGYVYLLVNRDNPSIFVKELIKKEKQYIDFIDI